MLRAAQTNAQGRGRVLEHVRVGFLVQLRDKDNRSGTDTDTAVGRVEYDGIGAPRTAAVRNVALPNQVEPAASVHKPARWTPERVPRDRREGHARPENAKVLKDLSTKELRTQERVSWSTPGPRIG